MCEYHRPIVLQARTIPALYSLCESGIAHVGKDRATCKLVAIKNDHLVFRVYARVGGKRKQRTVIKQWAEGMCNLSTVEAWKILEEMRSNNA